MRKQNVILSLWLVLPFVVIVGLMAWIFVSLDKERLMDDAVPIGAGAGDTGNANALGELLFGHDPDAISQALTARRERKPIDPRAWPGGIRFIIPTSSLGENPAEPLLISFSDEPRVLVTTTLNPHDDGTSSATIHELLVGRSFFASPGPVRIVDGKLVSEDGRALRAFTLEAQVPEPDLQTSDPMLVRVEIDSIYED